MKRTGYLGELEQMILLAVLQLNGEAFGTNVLQELSERVGRTVSRGALYVTLDRLEEKGMLTSQLGDPTPRRGGKPKRYLTVTPAGLAAVRRSRTAWLQLWEGLDSILEQQ
jgi:DNA-binding PadR family transcriptional regulator